MKLEKNRIFILQLDLENPGLTSSSGNKRLAVVSGKENRRDGGEFSR